MNTIERLERISEEVNNKGIAYDINNGGCGLFAALIAENFDLKNNIYAQYYGNENPNKTGFEYSSTQHILIEANGKLYDCSGFKERKYLSGYLTKISYDLLLIELENVGMWNSHFTYSGVISSMLNIINS